MSSRNGPSNLEPDAKRHKLDDQDESSDDDGSIIDATLSEIKLRWGMHEGGVSAVCSAAHI